MSSKPKYTDAQKIAYYKKLAGKRSDAPKPRAKRTGVAKANVVRGYGDYSKGWVARGLKSAGSYVGGYLGNAIGEGFSSITGMGDYKVVKNALMNMSGTDLPAIVNRDNHGGTIIRHKEMLGDIVTSATANTFNLQSFPLQPGNVTTFPWLSQIASNYQEYSLEGLIFEFRTMSADALNSTNTALGQVIMATNYNAAAPVFGSKQEMENSEFSGSTKPSCSLPHFIECAPNKTAISTQLYVRTGTVANLPAGTDIRLYDWGNFQIATNGFQGTNVNVGELWVSYQVSFSKPLLSVDAAGGLDIAAAVVSNVVANSCINTAPFGQTSFPPIYVKNNMGAVFTPSGNTITFTPPAYPCTYQLVYSLVGTSAVTAGYWSLNFTHATVEQSWLGGNSLVSPPNGTASSLAMMFSEVFTTDGTGQSVTITFTGTPAIPSGNQTMRCLIAQLPLP